jgi:hypothetical protein
MMFSPRNHIELHHVMQSEIESVDTLFEICDAEFNSRVDIHNSFKGATSYKKWARYPLLREVQKIAIREGISCSEHLGLIIACRLSKLWFNLKWLDTVTEE